MSVNRTITLSWKGEEYPLTITMRHIDIIEEEVNLMKMVRRSASGDVRFSHAANLVSILLRIAGAKDATQEAVYSGMFGSEENSLQPAHVAMMVGEILDAIFYNSKKNEPAGKKLKPVKRSKTTRGKTSTK